MELEPSTQEANFYQGSFDLFAGGEILSGEKISHLDCNELKPDAGMNRQGWEHNLQIEAEGYSIFCFAKDNPEKNCFRRYIISYQPSLWDKYTVSRQWGRVGSDKQFHRDEHFRSPRPALARVQSLIKRRVKRGYRLTTVS